MKTKHTRGPWKILPCPVHAGKHPFHDARWIATVDAVVEKSPHVPNDWTLESGSLICQMRDCPEAQDANARLIAAAPELLAALKLCADKLAMWPEGSNPEFFPSLKSARAAIAKAEGSR